LNAAQVSQAAVLFVSPRPTWRQLFLVRQGEILSQILPQILIFGGWSAAIVFGHKIRPDLLRGHPPGPYALIGIALSIFYSFRNNACYERWWEARCQWGRLVLTARSFARQTLVLQRPAPAARRRLLRLTIAFCQALVPHLRPGASDAATNAYLTEGDRAMVGASHNRPDRLARLIGGELAELRSAGLISDILYQLLDRSVGDLAEVQGACERIRNTPVPFSYNLLLQRTTYLFCFFLPFGFVDTLGWGTVIATVLLAYTFFGLDVLGDELEQPFASRPNNVPIRALADTIAVDLLAALEEPDLPPLPQPVDGILM
jgi:putative membrane protein